MNKQKLELLTVDQLIRLVRSIPDSGGVRGDHKRRMGFTMVQFRSIEISFRPAVKYVHFSISNHATQCRSEGEMFQECIRRVLPSAKPAGRNKYRSVNDFSLHGKYLIDDDWDRLSAMLVLRLYHEFVQHGVVNEKGTTGSAHD